MLERVQQRHIPLLLLANKAAKDALPGIKKRIKGDISRIVELEAAGMVSWMIGEASEKDPQTGEIRIAQETIDSVRDWVLSQPCLKINSD